MNDPSPPPASPPHRFFPSHRSPSRISSFLRSCFGSLCGGRNRSFDWDDFVCCNPGGSNKDDDGWRMRTGVGNASSTGGVGGGAGGGWAQEEQLLDPYYDDHYVRPPGWKRFLRKLRSETRKMNCSKPSTPGFQYDSLSYAMNFDDGAWQPQPQQQQPQAYSQNASVEASPLKSVDHGMYDTSYGRI